MNGGLEEEGGGGERDTHATSSDYLGRRSERTKEAVVVLALSSAAAFNVGPLRLFRRCSPAPMIKRFRVFRWFQLKCPVMVVAWSASVATITVIIARF